MSGRDGRLSKLEAERAEWKRKHIVLAEIFACLEEIFEILQEEAGQPAMSRIATRMVSQKAQRVASLQRPG